MGEGADRRGLVGGFLVSKRRKKKDEEKEEEEEEAEEERFCRMYPCLTSPVMFPAYSLHVRGD